MNDSIKQEVINATAALISSYRAIEKVIAWCITNNGGVVSVKLKDLEEDCQKAVGNLDYFLQFIHKHPNITYCIDCEED